MNGGSQLFLAGSVQANIGGLTPPSESRLELDEDDDSPRFYGPTSQRYIQHRSFAAVDERSDMPDTSTEELKMDSAPLRSLLFHNWWQIQPNSVVVVDEALFQSSRQVGGRSEYYSTFLENSLLACATRISTSESVRALGPKYAERAKTETAQELEYPNIATLQGFLLLSDFEATRGRDRLGYMYCGKQMLTLKGCGSTHTVKASVVASSLTLACPRAVMT